MSVEHNGDPPVDEALAAALAQAIGESSPLGADLLRKHLEDYGEVLPHILAADVARCYSTLPPILEGVSPSDVDAVVTALGQLFVEGGHDMQDVIATGFVEALPREQEEGRDVVDKLPHPLRDELHRLENWRPEDDAQPPG